MQETKVCAIILDEKGRLLLQLRDEEPQADAWVLFGGGVEQEENELQALRRELNEELGYNFGDFDFFGRYQDGSVAQAIYIAKDTVSTNELSLHEGRDMKFFGFFDLQTLKIGFNFKDIINDYFEKYGK